MMGRNSSDGLARPSTAVALSTTAAVALVSFVAYSGAAVKLWQWVRVQRLLSRRKGPDGDGSGDGVVSELFIHPVKSLRSVSLNRAVIDKKGLRGDRRFMVVAPVPLPVWATKFEDGNSTHRFLTQRQCPSLATVEANLDEEKDELTLSCGDDSITICVSLTQLSGGRSMLAGIWGDQVRVWDLGDAAAKFLQAIFDKDKNCRYGDEGDDDGNVAASSSAAMYQNVRLVFHCADDRPADGKYVPAISRTWLGSSPKVSLTDGFPILIACESSLTELNRRLASKGEPALPMSRFRPNIVIRGTLAFEEDNWKTIAIGDVLFSVVKACPRCKQSCTDQQTGEVTEEPVRTMKEFRALGHGEDVYFAQNALPLSSSGEIHVGDVVRVLERGDPVYE